MIFFRRSFTGRESYVKAPFQMLFIQRTAGYATLGLTIPDKLLASADEVIE
jgi:hypothetical protein